MTSLNTLTYFNIYKDQLQFGLRLCLEMKTRFFADSDKISRLVFLFKYCHKQQHLFRSQKPQKKEESCKKFSKFIHN